jgi:hypothetical protein
MRPKPLIPTVIVMVPVLIAGSLAALAARGVVFVSGDAPIKDMNRPQRRIRAGKRYASRPSAASGLPARAWHVNVVKPV